MRRLCLALLLVALASLGPMRWGESQTPPYSVNCAPGVPCSLSGPFATGTGDSAGLSFGKLNTDNNVAFATLQPSLNGAVCSNGNSNATRFCGAVPPTFSVSVSDSPASSVNNYSPGAYAGGVTVRLLITAASGGTTITGLSSTSVPDGFTELLCDQSTTDSLILPNQSSSSTAGNQWLNGGAGSVTIGPGVCVPITYVVSNWRVIL